jgi:hypothetical protein
MSVKNLFIKLGIVNAKKASKDLGSVDNKLKGLGKSAVAAGAAFFGAQSIISGLQKSIDLAAKLEGMRRGFDNLAKSAGFSAMTFEKLRKATNNTMSSMDLMQQANNAMLLGIFESEDQMAKMFDTAQRLAQALGKDAAFGIESLVTGMGRQSKLMLDNLGIMVQSEDAYKILAHQLGVSVEQLTDQQRKQAFVNAAMKEANKLVADLGDEQLTTADSINQMKTSVGDLSEAFGIALAPSVRVASSGVQFFASSIDAEEVKAYGSALLGVGGAWIAFTKGAIMAQKAMLLLNKVSKKNVMIFGAMVTIGALIDKFNIFSDETGNLSDELENLDKTLKNYEETSVTGIELAQKLQMAQFLHGETLREQHPLEMERRVIAEELNQIREKHGVTEANFGRMMEENIPFQIAYAENQAKQITVEKQLDEVRKQAVSSAIGSTGKLLGEFKGGAVAGARLSQLAAIADMYAGANKAFAQGGVLGFATAAGVIAAGLSNIMQISKSIGEMKAAATGFDGIVNKPTMFLTGEAGPESVQVTPLTPGMNQNGPQQGLTVNISSPLLDDSVVDSLIPKIEKAVGRGQSNLIIG